MSLFHLSQRAFNQKTIASSWEEIWEAGPYYDRVAELLEDATDYAVFVGWQIDSRLSLKKPSRPHQTSDLDSSRETLKEKLIRICNEKPRFQFYFLMWDHAYFYVLERELWQGRIWERVHPRVHFVFDNRHPFGGSHHEKVCIVDGKVALCGGIDLCDERWDTPQHLYFDPRRSLNWKHEGHGPYHDLAVQVTGPVCAGIQEHIASRWRALSSIDFPDPLSFDFFHKGSVGHSVYLSRTIAQVDQNPHEVAMTREVEFLFRDLIQLAEKRIILEGQYFWSQTVNDMLISKIHQMSGKNFEIVLILADLQSLKSLTRHMMAFELSLLRKLELAANYAGIKLVIGSPYVFAPQGYSFLPPRPVYIHSKILVIDDRYLGIGSANFAARALRIDTEIHLTLEATTEMEHAHIRRVANQILEHWRIETPKAVGDVGLRAFKPDVGLRHLKFSLERSQSVPWHSFLDPLIPWSYPIKFKYRRMVTRHFPVVICCLLFIWVFGIASVWSLAGVWRYGNWVILYSIVLSSVWLVPVPFILTSFLCAFQLGIEVGTKVGVFALWVASILGYALARAFPTPAGRFYRKAGPEWVLKKMGLRDFPILISVLLDPRVSLRAKIVYQGLSCVPFPWFALGTGVILPAILYVALRWVISIASILVSPDFLGIFKHNAGLILLLISVFSICKDTMKSWKKAG